YVPHRHVYGEQWIKFMKDGVNATPLPTVNTTGYIDHAAFLGTINPDTNKIPKHLFLLVLILLLMPTLNFLPVWFALSLLRFRLPSRLPMMFILWMVAMMVVIIPSRTV